MQVQKISRILTNKMLLKSLEKVSEHGTSFCAGTSLLMSLSLRPLAIFSTPDVEKENKQYACANSICSGLIKYGMVEAVALPVENAVKNIDKNPDKFLKPKTIVTLKAASEELLKSKSYKLATQMIKLGTGLITAIPKSVLTIALIPVIMDKLFNVKKHTETVSVKSNPDNIQIINSKKIPFTGGLTESLSKGIGKLFDNENFQKFMVQHAKQEKDIAINMTAATDILLTATSAYQTHKSSKIKENRKKALIYNNLVSTAITLGFGYGINSFVKNKSGKFIETFSELNRHDPKLHKYIEGINIIRPALIFAGIYYGILPMFSTYIAEKIDKYVEKNSKSQNA